MDVDDAKALLSVGGCFQSSPVQSCVGKSHSRTEPQTSDLFCAKHFQSKNVLAILHFEIGHLAI